MALAWLVAASLIAAGSAGLVAGLEGTPGTAARPELTWAADTEATAALDMATARMAELSDAVDALGETGRRALSALPGRDVEQLTTALAAGDGQVAEIEQRRTAVADALAEVAGIGPDEELTLSPDVVARFDRLVAALAATDGLDEAWARLADGGVVAIELTSRLDKHDLEAAEAARLGAEDEDYAAALVRLDAAEAALAGVDPLRQRLAASTDTTVLDEWLRRNRTWDAALRSLYVALIATSGQVTDAVRVAAAAERDARTRLPADTRALVVILGEIGRGGMNQAVIEIEQVRGALSTVLESEPEEGAGR